MWYLRGIFVAGTYMAVACEVDVTVWYLFLHMQWHIYVQYKINALPIVEYAISITRETIWQTAAEPKHHPLTNLVQTTVPMRK